MFLQLQHAAPDNETAIQVETQLLDVFETVYARWGNEVSEDCSDKYQN